MRDACNPFRGSRALSTKFESSRSVSPHQDSAGFPMDQGWRRLVIGPADSRKAEWRCVNACGGRGAGTAAAVSESAGLVAYALRSCQQTLKARGGFTGTTARRVSARKRMQRERMRREGAVATTFVAGVEAVRQGLAQSIGECYD